MTKERVDEPTIDQVREALRVLMLEQQTTGERRTYTDGFASGLCEAIHQIDRATRSSAPQEPVDDEGLERVKAAAEYIVSCGCCDNELHELRKAVAALALQTE